MSNISVYTDSPRRPLLGSMVGSNAFFQILTTVLILALWEGGSRWFNLGFWLSSPSAIVLEIQRWAASGNLWLDMRMTLTAAGLGFIIGSLIGAITGFVLGWIRRLGDLFEPFVLALYTIPKIALAPLFVLWFGIGLTNKVMFSGLLVFFMVFVTTYQGTRQVDRDLVENARLLGARRFSIWTKIAIPYSAVWMLAGIRIGLPYALIGAIVGEFVASTSGVGFRIKEATSYLNTAGVFAGLVVLMAISLILLSLLKIVERRALGWQNAKGEIRMTETA
jgi:NitT/TauT family transport system permease protein